MNKHADILLVEDNSRDAELTIKVLTKCGLGKNLLHLGDGSAALEFIFGTGIFQGRDVSDIPNVILLDLKLPKVDGITVLRELRADQRTKLVPVVVLSSSREDRDVLQSYQLGVNSYIVKPVDYEKFSDAICKLGLYWALLNVPPASKT